MEASGIASCATRRARSRPSENQPGGQGWAPARAPACLRATTAKLEDTVAVPDRKPRRFYGAVDLDPLRLTPDAGQIAEAIVQHLTGLVGGEVKVRLEVEAEVPEGVPEDVVRTVTENTGPFDSTPTDSSSSSRSSEALLGGATGRRVD